MHFALPVLLQLGEEEGGGTEEEVEGDPDAVQRAKNLEVQAVQAAEEGSLGDALELLNRAVAEAPNYASPYNNRAQVSTLSEVVRVDVLIPLWGGL